jgi:hypothetical protein
VIWLAPEVDVIPHPADFQALLSRKPEAFGRQRLLPQFLESCRVAP